MKRFFSKFVPEAPILVAAALLVTMPSLRGTAAGLATVFPFTVLAAALLLGWRFNRSRLVFAIALLALTEYVLLNGLDTPRDRTYFHALAFLLPINLALVALLPERGTLTAAGLFRWILLGVQVVIVAFLAKAFTDQTLKFLSTRVLPARLFAWTPVHQPAIIAFLAIGVLLVMAWLRLPQPGHDQQHSDGEKRDDRRLVDRRPCKKPRREDAGRQELEGLIGKCFRQKCDDDHLHAEQDPAEQPRRRQGATLREQRDQGEVDRQQECEGVEEHALAGRAKGRRVEQDVLGERQQRDGEDQTGPIEAPAKQQGGGEHGEGEDRGE